MKISMDKNYTTLEGDPVVIYSTSGVGNYPVHGAIAGEINTWAVDGRYWPKGSKNTTKYDLLEVGE